MIKLKVQLSHHTHQDSCDEKEKMISVGEIEACAQLMGMYGEAINGKRYGVSPES